MVIGDINVLLRACKLICLETKLNPIAQPEQGKYEPDFINVVSVGEIEIENLQYGKVQAQAGKAAFEFIRKAVELANSGKLDAIATTPINKEALRAAGVDYIGHTEILAALTGSNDPLTMFQVYDMRVFFLSRHVSLRNACDIKKEKILDYIIRCSTALKSLGLENGCLAVAGLNPHNGEHGLFGDEEGKEIEPAIAEARGQGINVTGPIPADSVFYQALHGRYAAVLSLYHDQGHIATKTVDFERTISLTLGMPFLRTSVDHGTAFDIAGQGIASSVSMEEAIRLAAEYGSCYKNYFK